MLYIRGEPMKKWLEFTLEERKHKALNVIENLFPIVDGKIMKYFQDFQEVVWDEDGSGAYMLNDAENIRNALQPIDHLVFSPVPRCWINDAIEDGKVAINQTLNIFNNS